LDRQNARSGWRLLVPKSAIGIATAMVAASVGAAFSGAVLFAYYNYRMTRNEQGVSKFAATFDARFKSATKALAAERDDAKAQIRRSLEPIQGLAGGESLEGLVKKVSPSVWFIRTLDEAGQPSVGSAFAVASDNNRSFLLTSYATVRAATHQPGPALTATHGSEEVPAAIWTWQEDRDLALLSIPKPNIARLAWAGETPAVKTGDRIFAVSGLGADGGAIAPGFVADVSAETIQHGVPIGPQFQGGPLINARAEVLAMASRAYAPLGFTGDAVFFGVPIHSACDKVLRCPGGNASGAPGQKR